MAPLKATVSKRL